ncbi:MAG: glycosyltransferase [Actinobacteria bacterium]|nr:glycosyltransferase [Actinomycetota bacterium]
MAGGFIRLLQVIQELRTGGAERVTAALLDGAGAAGHEVAVAAAPGPLSATIGYRTFDLPLIERRPSRVPAAAWRLRQAIAAFEPDLLHVHNPGVALVAGLATLRGRRPAGLASVHGVPEERYAAAARTLRAAGLPVVACGPGVAAALSEFGLAPVATIVNGVAPAPASTGDPAALRAELGAGPGRRLVVAVGRLAEQKRHALAVRAVAELPTDVHLAVVGDGPLRSQLAAEAHRAGIADRVVFTGIRADARAIMAVADAVVLASAWEGLPLVGLEAMASGAPLVATAVRGIRELVRDGVDGLLAGPDGDGLARALRRVLEDGGLSSRLAAGGAATAARHTEARMVEEYLALYERLVDR